MSVNSENASLILNTRDAIKSNANTTYTWNNINLNTLLGQMYDKYEAFNVCLSFCLSQATTVDAAITTVNDRNCIIYMEGLPWLNQTYSAKTNTNGTQTVIGFIQFPTNTSTTVTSPNFQSFYCATFGKNCNLCNITLQLKRIDNATPQATNDFPDVLYCFDIYGVEPKTKLIDNRIKNI